jgi:hypothetical protein
MWTNSVVAALLLQMDASDSTGVAGLGRRGVVSASHFRASYVTLSRQPDFTAALRVRCAGMLRDRRGWHGLGLHLASWQLCGSCVQATREFAAAASERLGLRIFPYSVFHIFFEQYLTIGGEALTLLGSGACRLGLGRGWTAPSTQQPWGARRLAADSALS